MISVEAKFTGRIKLTEIGERLSRAINLSAPEIEMEMAEDFVQFFRKKLRGNGLGLTRLSPFSVKLKRARGNTLPSVPFYAKGAEDERSFYSMVEVRRMKTGVKVGAIGNRRHHSGLTIKRLAVIHATGFKTKLGNRTVVVPPRNPVGEAIQRYDATRSSFRVAKIVLKRFSQVWK